MTEIANLCTCGSTNDSHAFDCGFLSWLSETNRLAVDQFERDAESRAVPIDIARRVHRGAGQLSNRELQALAHVVALRPEVVALDSTGRHVVETVLCRNVLPWHIRADRVGASDVCHAEVPIPVAGGSDEVDLRFMRCPACGGPLL